MNGSATIIWRITGKIPLLEVASSCMLDARTIGRRIAKVQSHIFNFCTFVIAQSYTFSATYQRNTSRSFDFEKAAVTHIATLLHIEFI